MRDDQTTNAQMPAPASPVRPDPSVPPDQPDTSDQPGTPGRWQTSLVVPLVIVLLAAGVIAALVFVSRQEQDSGGAVLAQGRVDGATLPVTVPYREIAGAIVIDVTLGDGGRTVPMILDTGAPTIVSEATARAHGGEVAGTVTTVSVDGQVLSSDVVPLPWISIGGAVVRDVGAVVGAIEPGNPFYCMTRDGFVGSNLMRTAVWQIDPRSQRLTIAASIDELAHIDGASRLEFTPASDISPSPLVDLAAGEGALTFLLDTGSNGWLAVNPLDLRRIGLELSDDPPTMAILGSGASGLFTTRARWLDASAYATTDATPDAEPLLLATSEALPQGQGNAGTDYLSHFVVTIDWPGGAVYLDPVDPAVPLTPDIPPSASLAWDDGFVIGSYVEGLPSNAGLALGDEVLDIDGEDVTAATFDTFCRHLARTPASYDVTVAGEPPSRLRVAPVEGFFSRLAG